MKLIRLDKNGIVFFCDLSRRWRVLGVTGRSISRKKCIIMRFSLESNELYSLFRVEGSLSIENLVPLDAALKEEVDAKKNILLDLTGVSFIDSSSIQFIIHHHAELRKSDRMLLVAGVKDEIAQIFSITEINRKITVFESLQEALAFMSRR
jgi:anti-anti-sigma factor